jgi:hypothetical protein
MKQKIILIALIIILCSALIIGLFTQSVGFIQHKNNFARRFLPGHALLIKHLDIKFDSYYIAGAGLGRIYLGNEMAPWVVMAVDTAFSDTVYSTIRNVDRKDILSARLFIQPPYFYLPDLGTKSIFWGNINDWRVENIIHDSLSSDLAVPLSNSSFALRTFRKHALDYNLAKETINPVSAKIFSNILEQRNDGIFGNDGMLVYDRNASLLVYIYFYRNQYICMDTNLNIVYRANTIDTTAKGNIKMANIKTDNTFTLAAPPIVVNRNSCVQNKILFINSGLKADNENKTVFNNSSVIDLYDVEKGKYKHSVYIPNYNGEKMKQFYILNNNCIGVISGHYLLLYQFPAMNPAK